MQHKQEEMKRQQEIRNLTLCYQDHHMMILCFQCFPQFFFTELQNYFTKKWICDFISYPIFIKFSKDHA